jgi:hypothetical protein
MAIRFTRKCSKPRSISAFHITVAGSSHLPLTFVESKNTQCTEDGFKKRRHFLSSSKIKKGDGYVLYMRIILSYFSGFELAVVRVGEYDLTKVSCKYIITELFICRNILTI